MIYCPECNSESISKGWRENAAGEKINRRRCKNKNCNERNFSVNANGHVIKSKSEDPGFYDLGNEAVLITTPTTEVPTLESFLEEFKVDQDEWKVDTYKINKWPTTIKMQDDTIVQAYNYQIKASLIRRTPIKFEWPMFRGADIKPWKKKVNIIKNGV